MSERERADLLDRSSRASVAQAEAKARCWSVLAALLGLLFFLLLGAALLGAGALLAHVING